MYAMLQDGTRLFYDVYGSRLTLLENRVVEKPSVVFLHGGPGIADHTLYVPFWSQLSDIAQVIFLDMRGHGRSDKSSPDQWSLAQWGADVGAFCDVLGLQNPIIIGFSFGGWVALSYSLQCPDQAGALILCNTEAKVDFEARMAAYQNKGGERAAEIVREHANSPSEKTAEDYLAHCVPLFSRNPYTKEELSRCIQRKAVWDVFDQEEYRTFDFTARLGEIKYDTLVIAGSEDPEHPPACAQQMAESMPHAQLHIISDAGDPVYRDDPETTLEILRTFMLKHSIQ